MRQLPNYVDDSLVGDLVVHEQALALHFHQETTPQLLQVMGHKGLRKIHLLHYGGDGLLAVAQRQKDSEAVLIRKALADKGHDAEALVEIDRFVLFFAGNVSPQGFLVAITESIYQWSFIYL